MSRTPPSRGSFEARRGRAHRTRTERRNLSARRQGTPLHRPPRRNKRSCQFPIRIPSAAIDRTSAESPRKEMHNPFGPAKPCRPTAQTAPPRRPPSTEPLKTQCSRTAPRKSPKSASAGTSDLRGTPPTRAHSPTRRTFQQSEKPRRFSLTAWHAHAILRHGSAPKMPPPARPWRCSPYSPHPAGSRSCLNSPCPAAVSRTWQSPC